MSMATRVARILAQLAALDADVRSICPKCPHCGRPDGGLVRAGETRWDAGMVDRDRCQVAICPMRAETSFHSLTITVGVPPAATSTA